MVIIGFPHLFNFLFGRLLFAIFTTCENFNNCQNNNWLFILKQTVGKMCEIMPSSYSQAFVYDLCGRD